MPTISRALTVFLLALVTAGPLSAAAATTEQIAQAQTAASISGTISDSTGAPVSGAAVSLDGPTTAKASSDATGKFSFRGLKPGLYAISASKTGYNPATLTDYALTEGAAGTVSVTLAQITFSSLREIGRVVTSARRSEFNAGTASVAIVNQATFTDQAQPQVMRILDQTPGVVTGHPATTANASVPGAITIPNVRGGLSFETATLIDGHQLANGRFGNYVTTFLSSYALENIELIKGPGANAPQINYAVGGTLNFRTLEPTRKPQAQVVLSYDSYGGLTSNWRYTGTTPNGRLSYAFDYAIQGTPGPLVNLPAYDTLPASTTIAGFTGSVGTTTGANPLNGVSAGQFPNPNAQANPSNAYVSLVACCQPLNSVYTNKTELVKLRYKLSEATVATLSFLGSQTQVDQDGNTFSQVPAIFAPAATYNPQLPALQRGTGFFVNNATRLPGTQEVNNEPIFQADLRTRVFKNDSVIARYYTASINRLLTNPLDDPTANYTVTLPLYGTATIGGQAQVFNGQPQTVTIATPYFRQTEEDKLHGGSFEYDHFVGGNVYSLAFDQASSTTNAYSIFGSTTPGGTLSVGVPPGARNLYTTYLLRGVLALNPKTQLTLSTYFNTYNSRFAYLRNADGSFAYNTLTRYHVDPRMGLTYRLTPDVSLRASAGSAVAPPYANLQNALAQTPDAQFRPGNTSVTYTANNGGILPETTFGYNFGADWRFKDGSVFSVDGYLTNLFNQFITTNTQILPGFTPPGASAPIPTYQTQNVNLTNARYQGLEFSLRKDPLVGFGYTLQGALIRGYPYNLPRNFYQTATSAFGTNLGVLPGVNYQTSGNGFNAVSNQSIPYSSGYAEVRYRGPNKVLLSLGETYYGNNNSFNVPAFFVANASVRIPLLGNDRTTFQTSVDNLFGAYPQKFIINYGGNQVPLANGKVGYLNANAVGPRVFRFVLTRDFGKP